MLIMLLRGPRIHHHIVNVHQTTFTNKWGQNLFHATLENCTHIVQPEWVCRNWNRSLWVMKAIFSSLSSSIHICQYAAFKSRVLNTVAPASESKISCIWSKEWASFLVMALIFRKSVQNLIPPSFLSTRVMGEAQGLTLGTIIPSASIFSNSFSTTKRLGEPSSYIHWARSCNSGLN